MSPSPYVKKGYGEVSKKAEERIRKDIIIKCKRCNSHMLFFEDNIGGNYYHCVNCYRKVIIDNRFTQL